MSNIWYYTVLCFQRRNGWRYGWRNGWLLPVDESLAVESCPCCMKPWRWLHTRSGVEFSRPFIFMWCTIFVQRLLTDPMWQERRLRLHHIHIATLPWLWTQFFHLTMKGNSNIEPAIARWQEKTVWCTIGRTRRIYKIDLQNKKHNARMTYHNVTVQASAAAGLRRSFSN